MATRNAGASVVGVNRVTLSVKEIFYFAARRLNKTITRTIAATA